MGRGAHGTKYVHRRLDPFDALCFRLVRGLSPRWACASSVPNSGGLILENESPRGHCFNPLLNVLVHPLLLHHRHVWRREQHTQFSMPVIGNFSNVFACLVEFLLNIGARYFSITRTAPDQDRLALSRVWHFSDLRERRRIGRSAWGRFNAKHDS